MSSEFKKGLKLKGKDLQVIKAMQGLLPHMSKMDGKEKAKVIDKFKDALNVFYKKNDLGMTIEADSTGFDNWNPSKGSDDDESKQATHDVEKFEKLFDGPLKPWLDKIDRPDEFERLLHDLFDHISPSLQNSGALKNVFIKFSNDYQQRAKANMKKDNARTA